MFVLRGNKSTFLVRAGAHGAFGALDRNALKAKNYPYAERLRSVWGQWLLISCQKKSFIRIVVQTVVEGIGSPSNSNQAVMLSPGLKSVENVVSQMS